MFEDLCGGQTERCLISVPFFLRERRGMGNNKASQECAIKMREKKSPGCNTLTVCWVWVVLCGSLWCGENKRKN